MSGGLTFLLTAVLCVSFTVSFEDIAPPRYSVNLDDPPTERWREIVEKYADLYPILEKQLYKIVPKFIVDIVADAAAELDHILPAPYADEIRGVAKYTNSTVGDTLMGNLAYDFSAFHKSKKTRGACTSIIAVADNGTLFHGRNLDYSFHDLLRNFTIIVDFKRNGTTVYTGTTFAGYVGLLTGMRRDGISISLNERNTGEWWENVLSAIKTRLKGLVGTVIRDTLEDKSIGYEEAVRDLSSRELIAPCYLIVGGVNETQASVITRDRTKANDVWRINATKGEWYILETNYDHWEDPPTSDDRRGPAIRAMNALTRKHLDMHTLYTVLSTPPILNNETAYTTIMSVKSPTIYYTMIRRPTD